MVRRVSIVAALGLLISLGVAAEDFGILNQYEPEVGVVFGGQPSAEQVGALAAAGFKTILDLRGVDEDRGFDEVRVVGEAGLSYVSLPITRDTMAEDATFDRYLELFRESERPILVHCASGNRVGALYYAYLVSEKKMTRAAALDVAQANGLRSLSLVDPVDRYLDSR